MTARRDTSADSAARCTGLTARWCPRCGDCACGPYPAEMNSWSCPLHAPNSQHAEPCDDPPLSDREAKSCPT